MIPHEIMIRLSHFRALQRSTISVPGTSSRKYPTKNTPAPKPNTSLSNPGKSRCIVRPAIATLVRSTYATM